MPSIQDKSKIINRPGLRSQTIVDEAMENRTESDKNDPEKVEYSFPYYFEQSPYSEAIDDLAKSIDEVITTFTKEESKLIASFIAEKCADSLSLKVHFVELLELLKYVFLNSFTADHYITQEDVLNMPDELKEIVYWMLDWMDKEEEKFDKINNKSDIESDTDENTKEEENDGEGTIAFKSKDKKQNLRGTLDDEDKRLRLYYISELMSPLYLENFPKKIPRLKYMLKLTPELQQREDIDSNSDSEKYDEEVILFVRLIHNVNLQI